MTRSKHHPESKAVARGTILLEYLESCGRPLTAREAMQVCGCHTYAQLRRACESAGILTGPQGVRLRPIAPEHALESLPTPGPSSAV